MNTFFKLRIMGLKGFMTAVFGNLKITPEGDNEFKVEWDSFATNELGVFDTMFGKEGELMSMMILDAFFPGRRDMCSLLPESRDNFKPLFANSKYIKGFGTKIPVYVYPPKDPVHQRMVTVNMADMVVMYEYRNCLEALYLWVDKNNGSKEFFKGWLGRNYEFKHEQIKGWHWKRDYQMVLEGAEKGITNTLYADMETSLDIINNAGDDNISDADIEEDNT